MNKKNRKRETVLVTGGAGFIGSHLSKKLADLGYEIVIIDNFNFYYNPRLKKDRVKNLLKGKSYKLYRGDINNFSLLEKIFKKEKIDIVCHLAAQAGVRYSLENPFVYEDTNIKGTLNLLDLSREFKINNFVFASSSSVYGERKEDSFREADKTDNPVSFYGATKKAGEILCYSYHKSYKIPITCLRYFTVYGPWGRPDMALFKFAKNISEGSKIEVYGYGKMKRDFTYIDDIVDGTVKAIEKNYAWEIFNLGYGRPVMIRDFIRAIEKNIRKEAKIKYLPMQAGDVSITFSDISKAKKLLAYNPKTPIKEGVGLFVKWFKEYYEKNGGEEI